MLGNLAFKDYEKHMQTSKRRTWSQSRRQTIRKAYQARMHRLKMKRHKRQ